MLLTGKGKKSWTFGKIIYLTSRRWQRIEQNERMARTHKNIERDMEWVRSLSHIEQGGCSRTRIDPCSVPEGEGACELEPVHVNSILNSIVGDI